MFTTNLAKTSTIYAREDQVIRIFVDISWKLYTFCTMSFMRDDGFGI